MSIQSQDKSPIEDRMNCMEVWGGNEATHNHIIRPGLDIWIRSQSQSRVATGGGDLHLLSSCASGRITRILLADICAFGPLFAEIAGSLRELMKRNVNSIQQGRVVRQMSCQLERASPRGGFASTLISTYFAPTRRFNICNAGHPPPLLFRAEAGEWSFLKQQPEESPPNDVPFGVVNRSEYQLFKTKLEVGDMVLSYSNTLTECRGAEGRTIGLDGILDRVRHMDSDAPSHLPGMLIEQIHSEHADNLVTDDATLLLCRANEMPVAWRDNILAPLRLFRSVSDKTKIV